MARTFENEEKFLHYYVRNPDNNQPVGCVMICPHEDGTVSRGISICSLVDKWNPKAARGVAKSRLIKALKAQCNCEPISSLASNKYESIPIFVSGITKIVGGSVLRDFTTFKSVFKGTLIPFEKRMLTPPPKREYSETAIPVYVEYQGADAKGVYNTTDNSLIVFKNSVCNDRVYATGIDAKIRVRLISEKVLVACEGKTKFQCDYKFTSPSAAATVVVGQSGKGKDAWWVEEKNLKLGVYLKKIEIK